MSGLRKQKNEEYIYWVCISHDWVCISLLPAQRDGWKRRLANSKAAGKSQEGNQDTLTWDTARSKGLKKKRTERCDTWTIWTKRLWLVRAEGRQIEQGVRMWDKWKWKKISGTVQQRRLDFSRSRFWSLDYFSVRQILTLLGKNQTGTRSQKGRTDKASWWRQDKRGQQWERKANKFVTTKPRSLAKCWLIH